MSERLPNKSVYYEFLQLLNFTPETLTRLYKIFDDDFTVALESGNATEIKPNINIIDTNVIHEHVDAIKNTFVISIEIFGICAAYIRDVDVKNMCNPSNMNSVFVPYRTETLDELRLGDFRLTATYFVNTVMCAVEKLLEQVNITEHTDAVLTSCLFFDQQGPRTQFVSYDKLCEQNSLDPLANVDISFLCNLHLERRSLPITIKKGISHTASHLLVGMQLIGDNTPKCLMSVHLGHTIRLSYLQPNSEELGFKGNILDVDVAFYDKPCTHDFSSDTTNILPYTVVDFEMRASTQSQVLSRPFEAMTVSSCLHELCRRCILRIFQTKATAAFWIPDSLSYSLCADIFAKPDENNLICKQFMDLYSWNLSDEDAVIIQNIIKGVFSRSAALVSICIGSVAKRTGRLQPALGGISVALTGVLGTNTHYQALLRNYLNQLFARDTSSLIIFLNDCDYNVLGAAIYNSA